jgi:IS1 family transposase
MNKLNTANRTRIVAALVEGNSIRATCRMTGTAKNTVVKLLVDLGAACEEYQRETLVSLSCKRVQCDEIWSFCYAKKKNLPKHLKNKPGYGDVWTWTALDPDSKLMITWLVGERDGAYATEFMGDVASRLRNRVQLTTDGHNVYLAAVEDAFGAEVDYAMLVKIYGQPRETEHRYSPAVCTGCRRVAVMGSPDPAYVSTSYVERSNLTLRMGSRRFTRLTNAFSKKVENLQAAVALHMMHYNFARIHQTTRVSPAMAAGVTNHLWSIEEIVGLLDSN